MTYENDPNLRRPGERPIAPGPATPGAAEPPRRRGSSMGAWLAVALVLLIGLGFIFWAADGSMPWGPRTAAVNEPEVTTGTVPTTPAPQRTPVTPAPAPAQ